MIRVQAVYALPEHQTVTELDVPDGSTVRDLLDRLRAQPPFSSLDLETMPVGIHGEHVDRERRLAQGDRVELYRPLEVDPKEARRRRARDS
jgi:putative ubiquitin-RnfH superfamily antitoxin RatB of RatAB toxin-antitoxin module